MAKLKVLDNYNKKVLSGKCRGFLQNSSMQRGRGGRKGARWGAVAERGRGGRVG